MSTTFLTTKMATTLYLTWVFSGILKIQKVCFSLSCETAVSAYYFFLGEVSPLTRVSLPVACCYLRVIVVFIFPDMFWRICMAKTRSALMKCYQLRKPLPYFEKNHELRCLAATKYSCSHPCVVVQDTSTAALALSRHSPVEYLTVRRRRPDPGGYSVSLF